MSLEVSKIQRPRWGWDNNHRNGSTREYEVGISKEAFTKLRWAVMANNKGNDDPLARLTIGELAERYLIECLNRDYSTLEPIWQIQAGLDDQAIETIKKKA